MASNGEVASSGEISSSGLHTLRVLEEVAARQPCGLTALARATASSKTSVQRSLVTLAAAGWISQTPERAWRLTGKMLGIALETSGLPELRTLLLGVMTDLRDATGETVHLVVRDGREVTIIERVDSTQAVRTFVELGTRAPLVATASGLAILAQLPEEAVAAILSDELVAYTDRTVTDPEQLRRDIARTARVGYAVTEGRWRQGVSAVGVAIARHVGAHASVSGAAALAVSVPSTRFDADRARELGELAVAIVSEVRV